MMIKFFRKKEDDDIKTREQEKEVIKRQPKKEPPAPWGKKERLIILIVFGFTAISSILLYLGSQDWKPPTLPRNLINLDDFLGEEVIIIEKKPGGDLEEIASRIDDMTSKLSGIYGFYIYSLATDKSVGIYEREEFPAASLIKLPVMVAAYQAHESGDVDLDDKQQLSADDITGGAGSLQNEKPGYEITLRDAIKLMGKESDNTAYRLVVRILGEDRMKRSINSFGMTQTDVSENITIPGEIGDLLVKLAKGEILITKDRDELFEFITKTEYEDLLPKGIPDDIRVVHKYGALVSVLNDAGVVFSAKPYVVVVMTKSVNEIDAKKIIPEISKFIYESIGI